MCIRDRYLSLAENDESIIVVNAMQPMEQVHQDVISIIANYVSQHIDEGSESHKTDQGNN